MPQQIPIHIDNGHYFLGPKPLPPILFINKSTKQGKPKTYILIPTRPHGFRIFEEIGTVIINDYAIARVTFQT